MEFHFGRNRTKSKTLSAWDASKVNEFVLPFSFVQHETHRMNKFIVWAIECVVKKRIEKLAVRDLECGVRVKHKF